MIRDELQQLHKELWVLRDELGDRFPLPCTLDSLRFAVCELSEALDAFLRTKEGYKRNNIKEPDLYGELSDCALMLMTALGKDYKYINSGAYRGDDDIGFGLARLASIISNSLWDYQAGAGAWEKMTETALFFIARLPGMDMITECRKRMDKWRNKWMAT